MRITIPLLAFVGSISSLFAAWGPVEDVTPPGSDTQGVGVVSDLAGNAIVIVKNNAETPLQATSHPHSGIWQIYPDNLSAPFALADDADIGVDLKGNAIAVWTKMIADERRVQVSEKIYGGSWTPPVTVSQGPSFYPRVVIAPSGEATVSWRQQVDDLDVNCASERICGIWGPPIPIPGALGAILSPKMVVDEKGNLAAIWVQSDGVYPRVVVSSKRNSLWQSSPDFLSSMGSEAGHPTIGIGLEGRVFSAWIGEGKLLISSRGINGDWEDPVILSQKGEVVEEAPILLVDKKGNANVLWESSGRESSIQVSYKSLGMPWTPAKTIASHSKTVRAAMDAEGNITAAWIAHNSSLEAKVKLAGREWPCHAEKVVQGLAIGKSPFNHLVAVGTAGTQTIIWDNPSLANVQSSSFFFPDKPSIAYLSRSCGPPEGENKLSITGTSFESVKDVTFDGISAPRFWVHSSTSITVIVPPGVAGKRVGVQVITVSGTSASALYTYVEEESENEKESQLVHPPTKLTAHQERVRFATQTETINVLSWSPPKSGPQPVAYHIYRDPDLKRLVASVKGDAPLIFYDRNRLKGRTDTYYIVAEDKEGNLSSPATITLP
jgi:hypothetical protein